MNLDHILELEGVDLHYGSSHVLHNVSLQVGHRPLGILGRNGMGKSSLCQAIVGMQACSKGTIRFDGTDITDWPPEKRAQLGLSYVPQGRRIFRSLSVEEHLKIAACKGGSWSIERVYDTFPRLKERRKNLGDRLSGGEQQMLAIGRALLLNPKMMILDEPTEGLAPAIVQDVIELIKQISDEKIAILLVEQNVHAALAAVQDVAIMVGGEFVEICSSQALKEDKAMQKRHLGIEPGLAV